MARPTKKIIEPIQADFMEVAKGLVRSTEEEIKRTIEKQKAYLSELEAIERKYEKTHEEIARVKREIEENEKKIKVG